MLEKKLFVFTENYAPGGGNRYLIDLVNAISFKFKEIFVFTNKGGIFSDELSRLEREVSLGSLFFITPPLILNGLKNLSPKILKVCKILLTFGDPILFIFNVISFLLILIKLRPSQVLVCNGGYPAARGCLAMVISSKILGIPVAMSVVSSPAKRRFFTFFYEKLIDLLIWNSLSRIIVNAHFIADQLVILRGAPKSKLSVVYNGLENIDNPVASKKTQKEFLIGCVARVDREKGVFYLLDAFNLLVSKYPFLKLVIVGSGNASNELSAKVNSMGLVDKVLLPGHYFGDVSLLLSDFDIYAFPSLWEGFPYSILEAMRSGCAIVSTNVGGISEAIVNGIDGILVEPASSLELALGLEKLINDEQLRYRISNNAKKKFEDKFTLNQMTFAAEKIF